MTKNTSGVIGPILRAKQNPGDPPRIQHAFGHVGRHMPLGLHDRDDLGEALLLYWDEGRGDLKQANLTACRIQGTRWKEETKDNIRDYWPALLRVAEGPSDVPAVHMLLYRGFMEGSPTDPDPKKALRHLERAVLLGDTSGSMEYARHLLDPNSKLAPALLHDPERGLAILRQLIATEFSIADMYFTRYLIRNRSKHEVSRSDLLIIQKYAENPDRSFDDSLELALFYASDQEGTDYAGPGYQTSRYFLVRGAEGRAGKVRDACRAKLAEWNVQVVYEDYFVRELVPAESQAPRLKATPSSDSEYTLAQKTGDVAKGIALVGGIGGIMWVWSGIGLFLIGIATAINAVMLPIILVGVLVAVVVAAIRR